MRILFLSSWFPYPPDNGSKIRIFNLIKSLGRRHELTLLSFTGEDFDPDRVAPLRQYCTTIRTTPYIPFRPRRLKALAGFISTRPRSVVDTYSLEMAQWVEAEMAHGDYEAVIASQLPTAGYVEKYQGPVKIFEEVEVGVYLGRIEAQRGLNGFGPRLTWFKSAQYLRRLLASFDAATVVSAPEKRALAQLGIDTSHVSLIPNGIDVEQYARVPAVPEPYTLIFNGALTYSANYDAVQFFLDEIYPRLREQEPRVRFAVTGRTDGVALDQLPREPGVTFTGYVQDIGAAVANSSVCVVPLQEGGGTRLKILEAMALGTPVVSTSKGAEGLSVTPGENILIADDPVEFASHVLEILHNPLLRARLTANARKLVQSKYDARAIGDKFEVLLQETVERRSLRLAA